MKTIIPLATVGLGVLLLALSFLWVFIFPPEKVWTPEKAARLEELNNVSRQLRVKLSQASSRPSMHSGESAAELKEQYDQNAAEYKMLYEQFRSASETPKTIADVLKWAGIGLALLGAAGVYMVREA